MSSTVSTRVGDMVVVTHVRPAAGNSQQQQQETLVGVQRFVKSRPQALGTLQIVIGLMILLFGIAMTPDADSLGVFSGIFVWGAGFYITAGSLTVAAGRRLTHCLVNCALGFSVVAAVTATTATILYSLDASGIILWCRYSSDDYYSSCYKYMSRVQGVSGVLAVFNLLQLIVSIVVASYACKATCNCYGETPSVIVVPAESLMAGQASAPHTEEMQNFKGEASMMTPPYPPAYSSLAE